MKKIYLDWSHLQNLLDKNLNTTEEKFLNTNYICFSFNHLADMSRGTDREKVLTRAKKIDSIPNKLFLKDSDTLQVMEVVRALEAEIIGKKLVPENVFISSHMYDLFDLTKLKKSADIEYIKKNGTFEAYINDVSNEKGLSLVNNMYERSYEMSKEVAIDRKGVISKKLQSELTQKRNYKIREGLTFFIGNALFILHLHGLPLDNFLFKDGHILISLNKKYYSLNDHFMKDDKLKFYHLFNEFMFLKGNSLASKMVESKGFQATKSDIADYGHLHALIFCDIVTCDTGIFLDC